jgi:sugar phosphate isomerase/epimerase
MRSAVTICLVPEARRGPFVYHVDPDPTAAGAVSLAACVREAAGLGFDAVEIFPADADAFPRQQLQGLLPEHSLGLAAVGTGAGWVKHGLSLTDPDIGVRKRASEFIAALIDVAGEFGAPAIIGSMQGRSSVAVLRDAALGLLAEALGPLGERAARHGQPLLYEPLNRYETDLFNRQAEAAAFLEQRGLGHVRLLCDLFHMNIEETDVAATLRDLGRHVGHVHWADSNRQAIGLGHTRPEPIVAALREIGFAGHLAAEVFPLPTATAAAAASIETFRRFVA